MSAGGVRGPRARPIPSVLDRTLAAQPAAELAPEDDVNAEGDPPQEDDLIAAYESGTYANEVAADEAVSEEALADEPATDEAAVDEAVSDEAATEEAPVDEAPADEVPVGEAVADEPAPEEVVEVKRPAPVFRAATKILPSKPPLEVKRATETKAEQKKVIKESKAAATKRRGPGRPPKKAPAPPLPVRGIVDSPSDADNRFEFVVSSPEIFKKLFMYFRQLRTPNVHIRFSKDCLTFFAHDHNKTSRVIARIAGELVTWFYCEDEFELTINRESVEKMFSGIDKSFFKITIIVRHDAPEFIVFILKDSDSDRESNYKFAVSNVEIDENLRAAEDELAPENLIGPGNLFPIQFTLSAKQFKKEISDASVYSDTVTIEKLGSHPLQWTFTKVGLRYHSVYRTAAKIRLYSEVKDGQTFACTLKVANVKSLATSLVADDIRILARETGDILFRSAVDDKVLVVSTLTKLA